MQFWNPSHYVVKSNATYLSVAYVNTLHTYLRWRGSTYQNFQSFLIWKSFMIRLPFKYSLRMTRATSRLLRIWPYCWLLPFGRRATCAITSDCDRCNYTRRYEYVFIVDFSLWYNSIFCQHWRSSKIITQVRRKFH